MGMDGLILCKTMYPCAEASGRSESMLDCGCCVATESAEWDVWNKTETIERRRLRPSSFMRSKIDVLSGRTHWNRRFLFDPDECSVSRTFGCVGFAETELEAHWQRAVQVSELSTFSRGKRRHESGPSGNATSSFYRILSMENSSDTSHLIPSSNRLLSHPRSASRLGGSPRRQEAEVAFAGGPAVSREEEDGLKIIGLENHYLVVLFYLLWEVVVVWLLGVFFLNKMIQGHFGMISWRSDYIYIYMMSNCWKNHVESSHDKRWEWWPMFHRKGKE